MPRDFQRSKVYKAERSLIWDSEPMTLTQIDAWAHEIIRSEWTRSNFNQARLNWIEIKDGRGRRSACANHYQIRLPKSCRRRWVVLHEIAHVYTLREFFGSPAHGREFCHIYLALTRRWMGQLQAGQLRAAFQANRVKWTLTKD